MDTQASPILESAPPAARPARHEVPFGVNEVRLRARQWIATLAIVATCLIATPRLWKKLERFETGLDYRIPYQLSKDYWLYERRLEQLPPSTIPVLGDSVVWGEYVLPDGTLSHFLTQQAGHQTQFANCGVNGLFPLALEGLVEHYGTALRNRQVIVQYNMLWMTSPSADLSAQKPSTFNHSRLVLQFSPRIPCYQADASERISVLVERNVSFSAWVGHLQSAYFGQRSIPQWTLEDDGSSPPLRPNAWRNPLSQITMVVPGEPSPDPDRGPQSPRHKTWNSGDAAPTHFEWVNLDASLQWQAFQRAVALLRSRGNDVFVILGPFNEHMIQEDQRPAYRALREAISAWLAQNQIPHIVPDTLPSVLYADASHPLTEGYAQLAKHISEDQTFRTWLHRSALMRKPNDQQ